MPPPKSPLSRNNKWNNQIMKGQKNGSIKCGKLPYFKDIKTLTQDCRTIGNKQYPKIETTHPILT